jgi:hypothetical protein
MKLYRVGIAEEFEWEDESDIVDHIFNVVAEDGEDAVEKAKNKLCTEFESEVLDEETGVVCVFTQVGLSLTSLAIIESVDIS